jgi:acyl-CoA thioesterase FadM
VTTSLLVKAPFVRFAQLISFWCRTCNFSRHSLVHSVMAATSPATAAEEAISQLEELVCDSKHDGIKSTVEACIEFIRSVQLEDASLLEHHLISERLSKLVCEFQSLHEEHNELKAELAALRVAVDKLRRENADLKGKFGKLQTAYDSMEAARNELWLRQAASDLFASVICFVLEVEDPPKGMTTLDELTVAIIGDTSKVARLQERCTALGLSDACVKSIKRVMLLGNAQAHQNIWADSGNPVDNLCSKTAAVFAGGHARCVPSWKGVTVVSRADADALVTAFTLWRSQGRQAAESESPAPPS